MILCSKGPGDLSTQSGSAACFLIKGGPHVRLRPDYQLISFRKAFYRRRGDKPTVYASHPALRVGREVNLDGHLVASWPPQN